MCWGGGGSRKGKLRQALGSMADLGPQGKDPQAGGVQQAVLREVTEDPGQEPPQGSDFVGRSWPHLIRLPTVA